MSQFQQHVFNGSHARQIQKTPTIFRHFALLVASLVVLSNKTNTAIMASDQIRQMVNFILQEAHEKANEIRVKVRYDLGARVQWNVDRSPILFCLLAL